MRRGQAATSPPRWRFWLGIALLLLSVGAFSSGDSWPGALMLVVGLGLIGSFLLARTAGDDDAAAPPGTFEGQVQTAPSRAGQYSPATPAGRPLSSWARETVTAEVAGESFYEDAFRAIFKRRGLSLTQEGRDLPDESAHLVHDRHNKHDPNAVVVWVAGQHVGFLAREQAAEYVGALDELSDNGAHLCVPARVWASRGYENRVHARVSLKLPPPSGVQPFNPLPEASHVVLPRAKTVVQVTGEEQHMDVLGPFIADQPRFLSVTLHLVAEAKTARSTPYQAVEVRLQGRRVGCLTKAMSEQVADLVQHLNDKGHVVVGRAVLKGSPLRGEVTLDVARSADVTSRWLDSITTVGNGSTGG